MAEQRYRTIVADPPWQYEQFVQGPTGNAGRINKPLPYPGMTLQAIEALPVADWAEPASWLFLWTTNRYLRPALEIAEAWGFTYRQTVVWRKTGCPTPFAGSIAPNHAEFLLVCRRGGAGRIGTWPTNVIDAPAQTQHSAKPEVFLDMVEAVCPGPYLEMFARRARFGWDTWGDEALGGLDALVMPG